VSVSGTMVTCDTVSRTLEAAGTPAGQAFVSSYKSLPGPLEPTMKPEELIPLLDRMSPGRTALKALLLQLTRKPKFDWAQDWPVVARALAEEIDAASPYTAPAPQGSGLSARQPDPSAVATIQSHLMAGRRSDAVTVALEAGQHAHALMIAYMSDKETYVRTVERIIAESVAPGCPLAQAYRIYNDLPLDPTPRDVQANDARLRGWVQHVVMLASNYAPPSLEGIVAQGDALAQARNYDDAHFCYLLAQLSPDAQKSQEISDALRSKYTLLGGVHRREQCRSLLLTPRTFVLTEALEYARRRLQDKYVRPQQVPFKAIIAVQLMEIGEMAAARLYLDALSKLLPSKKPAANAQPEVVVKTLPAFIDAQKQHMELMLRKPGSSGAGGGRAASVPSGGAASAAPAPTATATGPRAANTAAPSQQPKASSSTPPAEEPRRAQSAKPEGESGRSGSQEADGKGSSGRSGWLSGIWGRKKKEEEEKKAKRMILDSDDVPEYDPVTGRYKFKQTDEEKEVEERVKAGPPKMPMAAPAGAVAKQPSPAPQTAAPTGAFVPGGPGVPPMYPGMPPSSQPAPSAAQQPPMQPPMQPGGSPSPFVPPGAVPPGAAPFVPPGGGTSPPPAGGFRAAAPAPKYVDMFNS